MRNMISFEFPLLNQAHRVSSDYKEIEQLFLKRTEESLFASFLSLRMVPNIRYSSNSTLARRIAERLLMRLEREYTQNYKEFGKQSIECLIMDRRDDLITPLLYNWSYMSLVDEFLGVENNSVKLKDQPQVFGVGCGDQFLEDNWDKNYGELTMNLSSKISENCKGKANMNSLEDLKKVIDQMPDMKKEANNTKKHSEVIGEIISNVQKKGIYEVSELQQDIAVENDKSGQYKRIMEIIAQEGIEEQDKIKLSMLFCLKYSDDQMRVGNIFSILRTKKISTDPITK